MKQLSFAAKGGILRHVRVRKPECALHSPRVTTCTGGRSSGATAIPQWSRSTAAATASDGLLGGIGLQYITAEASICSCLPSGRFTDERGLLPIQVAQRHGGRRRAIRWHNAARALLFNRREACRRAQRGHRRVGQRWYRSARGGCGGARGVGSPRIPQRLMAGAPVRRFAHLARAPRAASGVLP